MLSAMHYLHITWTPVFLELIKLLKVFGLILGALAMLAPEFR
jgi:hypothetical protein